VFKKLFGGQRPDRSDKSKGSSVSPSGAPPPDPAGGSDMVRAYDSYGREVLISRQDWRNSVLLPAIKKDWGVPDRLASIILQALQDKFYDDLVEPAERLLQLEPDSERSSVLLAIVYFKLNRLDDAERLLERYVEAHGETGAVLSNLAEIYAGRGNKDKAIETLWRSLEMDPNQEHALNLYWAVHLEQGGEPAAGQALSRIASLRGSWRAQLWLGKAALDKGDLAGAMDLFREGLRNAPSPAPVFLLMAVSGELGMHGHVPELLELVAPSFEVEAHGLQVGNNLIKAYVDSQRLDEAGSLVEALYAQNRPDWKQHLNYWDREIAKRRLEASPVPANRPLQIAMLTINGPVWLPEQSPAAELFPPRTAAASKISFLGSSAEVKDAPDQVQAQLSDAPGYLSRALPLFLAEQVQFGSGLSAKSLVPWLAGDHQGFVLCGQPWSDEDAVKHAGSAGADYVVTSHIKAAGAPWQIVISLLRVNDSSIICRLQAAFDWGSPADDLMRAVSELLAALKGSAGDRESSPASSYSTPDHSAIPEYLLRLEQLLALRCANMPGTASQFLHGEREILDGNLQLCERQPTSLSVRLLAMQTFLAMKKCRPAIVAEYSDRIRDLQRRYPVREQPAHDIAERMAGEACSS